MILILKQNAQLKSFYQLVSVEPCKDERRLYNSRMVIWWTKTDHSTTTVFRIKRKICKKRYQKRVIFTNNKCKFNIVWDARNVTSIVKIKDSVKHYSCVVYEGNCSYGKNYVGESLRNVILRWAEHEDPNKQLEPARHLKYLPDHQCEWKVLSRAPEYTRKKKISQAFSIKSTKPSLNEQLDRTISCF